MTGMRKTTVYLEPELQLALREAARRQSSSQAELIREAIRRLVDTLERPKIRGIGAYRSGRGDISDRAEEILEEASKSRRWR